LSLTAGLGAVTSKLTDDQAKDETADLLLAAIKLAVIKLETNPWALWGLSRGLGALPAKLTDNQARQAIEPLLAAITSATKIYPLAGLGQGLEVLAAKLTDSQAKEAVKPFLAAIEGATNPYALQALGAGLAALYPKLDANSVEAMDLIVNHVLNKTRNTVTVVIYATLSCLLTNHLPREQQIATIFHVLRHPLIAAASTENTLFIRQPLTAGASTEQLLAILEQVQGGQVRFGGDLWKAVDWAEAEQKAGRLKGLDLDASMQVPRADPDQSGLPKPRALARNAA
jgi:hypothetical protein